MSQDTFIGVDVSNKWLDVYVQPQGTSYRFANDEEGIQELVSMAKELEPDNVVMEATGGLERAVGASLSVAGVKASIVNPRQVRDFARATGKLAKTDAIDAQVIAHFAQVVNPQTRPVVDEQAEELSAILSRRSQLTGMLTAEKNRLKRAPRVVRMRLKAHIAFLEKELKRVDKDLDEAIKGSSLWKEKESILKSIPGIGPVVSTTLITSLPELGKVSDKEVAALVGVAPFNRDSGAYRGRRKVWGGRARVRSALYMATLAATRHNPVIKVHYHKLLAGGKARKVALVACMRRLLVIANAMLRKGTHWDQSLHRTA